MKSESSGKKFKDFITKKNSLPNNKTSIMTQNSVISSLMQSFGGTKMPQRARQDSFLSNQSAAAAAVNLTNNQSTLKGATTALV